MNYVLLMTMTTMNSISTILSSIVADLIHLNAMYDEDCGGDRLEQARASTERTSKRTNVNYLVLDGHFVDDLDHDDHGHDLEQGAFDGSCSSDSVLLHSINSEACKRPPVRLHPLIESCHLLCVQRSNAMTDVHVQIVERGENTFEWLVTNAG